MIKVTGLNKYYNKGKGNEIHVINNTSFELPSTGLISFLGHSGSGKTTLLNVLGGLDKASGTIQYDDTVFNKYDMKRLDQFRSKHIGYVFQNYSLLLEETVYNNLRIALELIGVTDSTEIDKRIKYTLTKVGMYKFRKKKVIALSGGQQQRVSIARALIKNCKIIIADEPTGNLDSNNTIEVMNILKKISKSALVLLVTHEQNIAEFYSDYIFEMKDGKIINQIETSSDRTLQSDKSSVVHLKDMNHSSTDTPIGKINIYTDENTTVDLRIIVKNGTIYLDSDKNLKLVNNTNLKIVDDHYQEIADEDIDNFNYDTSWYNDLKDNKNKFKKLLSAFRQSFLSFKNVKKRIKLLYFTLVCVGFIFGIGVIALTNYIKIDDKTFAYNRNYYEAISETYETSLKDAVSDAYENNFISNVIVPKQANIIFNKKMIYSTEINYICNVYAICYQDDKVELLLGNKPSKDTEIVICKNQADKIIKASNNILTYDLLLNQEITLWDAYKYTISGISANDNMYVYLTLNEYCVRMYGVNAPVSSYNDNYDTTDDIFDYENFKPEMDDYQNSTNTLTSTDDVRYAPKEIDKDKNKLYTVVDGVDVDLNSSQKQVLVPDYLYGQKSTTYLNGDEYVIVGSFKYKYSNQNIYITNQQSRSSASSMAHFVNDGTKYEIVEGNEAQNDNEMMVSVYSNYKLGDVVSGVKVVGIFIGDNDAIKCNITTLNVANVSYKSYKYIFDIVDMDLADQSFSHNGFSLYDNYTAEYNYQKASRSSILLVFRILFIILSVVTSIFIYFIMRSKVISDVYSIGIYRSLGASRASINKKYILDVLVLTTFTSLIGYILAMFVYLSGSSLINDIFQTNFLMFSAPVFLLGIIGMYLIMIIFGMLPIILLLRRTPSEICSKYDI